MKEGESRVDFPRRDCGNYLQCQTAENDSEVSYAIIEQQRTTPKSVTQSLSLNMVCDSLLIPSTPSSSPFFVRFAERLRTSVRRDHPRRLTLLHITP